jgi:tetratricopeptide (TPR) repeat protein
LSYSHLDAHWLDKLREVLHPDIRNGRIDYRDDRNLVAGDDWYQEIAGYIARARVVVLLVSPSFLASSFIMEEELPLILEARKRAEAEGQGLTILWVPLSGIYHGPNAVPGAERVNRFQAVWEANQPLDAFPEKSRTEHLLDLCRQISRLVNPAPQPNNLPFAPLGDLLKGREADLARLDEQLRRHGSSAIVQPQAVSGPGGIGKTRLAVEYARRHEGDFTALLFVSASSPSDLDANLARLCADDGALDLVEYRSASQHDQCAAVIRWLKQNKGWLLILDNVDTQEAVAAVQKLLAKLTGGIVLVTSRITMWSGGIPRFPLDVLSPDAAVELLLGKANSLPRASRPDDEKQARLLAEQLGYLPLALTHAAAYVGEWDLAFDDYMRQFDEALQFHEEAVIEYDSDLAHDPEAAKVLKTVATTFFMSIDRLGPVEKAILRAACFLAPAPITMAIFADRPDEMKALVELWCEETGEPYESKPVRDAVRELVRYSLIERNAEQFTIHRMERLVLRAKAAEDRVPKWIEAVRAALIHCASEETAENPKTWPVWDLLRPHAEALVNLAQADQRIEPQTALPIALGQLYYGKGLYAQNLRIDEMVLEISRRIDGPESSNYANRMLNYGETLRVLGKYPEAEEAFRESLAISEKLDGPNSQPVASCLNYLALAVGSQGRSEEEEQLLRRALAIYELEPGVKSETLGKVLTNLGFLLIAKGAKVDLDEAEQRCREALSLFEEDLGSDHPRTLAAKSNLARALMCKGDYDAAEPLYRSALEIADRVLGSEHPHTVTHLDSLARLLEEKGDLAAAEPLLRRVMEANEKNGQAEQPQFAVHLNNHAVLLRKLKSFDEAAACFQRAIGIDDRVLRPDNPIHAHRRNNLAVVYMLANRLEKAAHVNRDAWLKKAGRHDVTSGRILFTRIALCLLQELDARPFLGRLRTLLAQPDLPCMGAITRQWEATDILDELRSRLTLEQADLLAALLAALDDPSRIADLQRFYLWTSTPPVPLEAPWPNEPESSN